MSLVSCHAMGMLSSVMRALKHTETDLRQLEALDVPTLVLAHRQDPIHPFAYGRRLADAIRGARLVEVTARSVNRRQHAAEMQHNLAIFLRQITEDRTWRLRRAAA